MTGERTLQDDLAHCLNVLSVGVPHRTAPAAMNYMPNQFSQKKYTQYIATVAQISLRKRVAYSPTWLANGIRLSR